MKRVWSIIMRRDAAGAPVVRIGVDGQELLPNLSVSAPIDALEYIDEGLVDFRRGDELTLSAWFPPRVFSTFTTRVRSVAILWCAEILQLTCFEHVALPARTEVVQEARRAANASVVYARHDAGPN